MTSDLADPATIPGGFAEYLSRCLPDGSLIEFEIAPAGYLTKTGEVRKRPWRAYHHTPVDGKRQRLISVTTLLDAIMPKGGLVSWAEAKGIEGGVTATRRGEIPADLSLGDAVRRVRQLGLGADAAKQEAATRGLNVHDLLRIYMETGSPPMLDGQPGEHHGYIRALTRFLLRHDPHPVAVEQLVASPDDGYAGRLDLRAFAPDGALVTWDAKTQANAGIYAGAHAQVALYERAAVLCGDPPADKLMIVVFAADGEYRVMAADPSLGLVEAALGWYRELRPVDAACSSANRAESKARA